MNEQYSSLMLFSLSSFSSNLVYLQMLPYIQPIDPPLGIPMIQAFVSECNGILQPVDDDPLHELNLHQYLLLSTCSIISRRYINYIKSSNDWPKIREEHSRPDYRWKFHNYYGQGVSSRVPHYVRLLNPSSNMPVSEGDYDRPPPTNAAASVYQKPHIDTTLDERNRLMTENIHNTGPTSDFLRPSTSPIFATSSEADFELRSSRVSSVPVDAGLSNVNERTARPRKPRPVDPLRLRKRIKVAVRALRTLNGKVTKFRNLPLNFQYRGMRLLELECEKMGVNTPVNLKDFLELYFNKKARRQ
ncbi:hypothetical protein BCR42DRAFT_395174 [Absidia repens]|uniref:Uncharacterized protein n=1 Tax=Absidia repens TaxID=90262 RepID=A0A1X2I898_9FUNG|nr:hypothetical protein BCR42DRAFT_395174 [Absidia repens]